MLANHGNKRANYSRLPIEYRTLTRHTYAPFLLSLKELTLANSPQAKKRARQAETHRHHNASLRSKFRTHIKKFLKAVDAGDKTAADAAYKLAVPVIDSTSSKGLIHANKAARHKSRLNTRLRALGS